MIYQRNGEIMLERYTMAHLPKFSLETLPHYFPTTEEHTNRTRYKFLREHAGKEPDPNRRAIIVEAMLKFKDLPYIHDNHVFRTLEGEIQDVLEEDWNEELAFT